LISPSQAVLKNFLRGTHVIELEQALKELCDLGWQKNYADVKEVVTKVLKKIYLSKSKNPSDLVCLYSVLNICHRLLVLSYLSFKDCELFINDYEHGKHIDPYDAFAYTQNLFLDFGRLKRPILMVPKNGGHEKYA
jgi:hypothetical protein